MEIAENSDDEREKKHSHRTLMPTALLPRCQLSFRSHQERSINHCYVALAYLQEGISTRALRLENREGYYRSACPNLTEWPKMGCTIVSRYRSIPSIKCIGIKTLHCILHLLQLIVLPKLKLLLHPMESDLSSCASRFSRRPIILSCSRR